MVDQHPDSRRDIFHQFPRWDDDIKNANYIKGSLNDPAINGHVARARVLASDTVAKVQVPRDPSLLGQFQAAERENPYASRNRWRWERWASVALMAIAGVIVLGYSRRGRKRLA